MTTDPTIAVALEFDTFDAVSKQFIMGKLGILQKYLYERAGTILLIVSSR